MGPESGKAAGRAGGGGSEAGPAHVASESGPCPRVVSPGLREGECSCFKPQGHQLGEGKRGLPEEHAERHQHPPSDPRGQLCSELLLLGAGVQPPLFPGVQTLSGGGVWGAEIWVGRAPPRSGQEAATHLRRTARLSSSPVEPPRPCRPSLTSLCEERSRPSSALSETEGEA